jgi:catechol 2,3-dioxygenase-like lactoylglutathione lyase family enzyme
MARLLRVAPEIPVRDLAEAVHYYQSKLGFVLVSGLPGYAILERDEVALHLFQELAAPIGLHIFTHDLDKLHAELERRGARILQGIERKPWGNREFRALDLSGNVIKFTEPLPTG